MEDENATIDTFMYDTSPTKKWLYQQTRIRDCYEEVSGRIMPTHLYTKK